MEYLIQSRRKYRATGAAPYSDPKHPGSQGYPILTVSLPKHQYRTRTGPNCCTPNCQSKKSDKGSGVRYSSRVARRNRRGYN